jgi:hypothetical protein
MQIGAFPLFSFLSGMKIVGTSAHDFFVTRQIAKMRIDNPTEVSLRTHTNPDIATPDWARPSPFTCWMAPDALSVCIDLSDSQPEVENE